MNNNIFGERVVYLRKNAGLTREELALAFNMSVNTLRNYELGLREPGHKFVVEIAKKFGVTTDYLLGLTEQTTYKKKPTPEQSEVGENNIDFESFREALYNVGILREGQNLTPHQARIILSLINTIKITLESADSDEERNPVSGAG